MTRHREQEQEERVIGRVRMSMDQLQCHTRMQVYAAHLCQTQCQQHHLT